MTQSTVDIVDSPHSRLEKIARALDDTIELYNKRTKAGKEETSSTQSKNIIYPQTEETSHGISMYLLTVPPDDERNEKVSAVSFCAEGLHDINLPFELGPKRPQSIASEPSDGQSHGKPNWHVADSSIPRNQPIRFCPRLQYELPVSLTNILPSKTVMDARRVIKDTYEMMPWMKNPENDFSLLLCQCAISCEDGDPFREWMASSEGQNRYRQIRDSLREEKTPEELALSLAALRCYELVLWDASQDSEPEDKPWIYEFKEHVYKNESRVRENLWRTVGASFKSACHRRCHEIALSWLDAVLDEPRFSPSSDGYLEEYWVGRLGVTDDALHDRPVSQPMRRGL